MPTKADTAMRADIDKVIGELMSPRIEKLSAFAHLDLYFGPINGCDRCGAETNDTCECVDKYTGFDSATDEIRAWAEENITDLWYDQGSGYISDKEPQAERCYDCEGTREDCEICRGTGWTEPFLEETYHLSAREVKVIVFGKELASYV